MNRIILIGNGFDLAHGLKTGYKHFMNNYWKNFASEAANSLFSPYEDKLVRFERIGGPESLHDACIATSYDINNEKGYTYKDVSGKGIIPDFHKELLNVDSYDNFKQSIADANNASDLQFSLSFKNSFWEHLSNKACLKTWLDIENEYYDLLKGCLKTGNRNEQVDRLNEEFCQVKELLEKYLTEVCEKELSGIEPNDIIKNEIFLGKGIESRCIALSKQDTYDNCLPEQKRKISEVVRNVVQYEDKHSGQKKFQAMMTGTPYQDNPLCSMNGEDKERFVEYTIEQFGVVPDNTLVLNFNYTSTFKTLYAPEYSLIQIINIHGELNNPDNPMIFGYGDELDDDYREIEKANDNKLLDNIKHILYPNSDNYRRFLEFLQLGPYQVFVLGHSCGNSDRTLLNTIFEHSNCTSVKPFYYQWKDEGVEGMRDNYTDIYKNISRNFNNKQNLRDIVVNKTYCKPLVPVKS